MQISENGIQAIRLREGWRNEAYPDSRGIPTIGVGHTGPEVHLGLVWTTAQVEAALERDLRWAENAVNQGVNRTLTQNQFDALVSFVFNIGLNGWWGSSVRRDINAGNMQAAADAFLMWETPPELKARREGERAQFLRPDDVPVVAAASTPSIQQIQEALNAAGAEPPIQVDGDFGAKTREAVKAFQTAHSLAADGIVGPQTINVLLPAKST